MPEYRTNKIEVNGLENHIYLGLRVQPTDMNGNNEGEINRRLPRTGKIYLGGKFARNVG